MLRSLLLAASAALLVNAVNDFSSLSCLVESKGVHVPGTVPCNPHEPLQHRLAYGGPDGMMVSWSTHARLDVPTVWYGESPLSLSNEATGYSVTYPTSRVHDNHVKLTGLKPHTKYWYRTSFQNCAGCAYRSTGTFTTARLAGDHNSFSFAFVADLGLMGADGLSTDVGPLGGASAAANPLGPHDKNTMQSLLESKDTFEFVAHGGDELYADYFIKESWQGYFGNNSLIPNMTSVVEGYNSLSEQFYDQMTPLTSTKPYMVAPGNHEANCDNGGTTDVVHNITYTTSICTPGQTNFTGYINHYRMPSDISGGKGNFWYSFDYGLAHFIILDTETDFPEGLQAPDEFGGFDAGANSGPFGYPNEQIKWFEKDLANVNRDITPWILVMQHRPWYIGTPENSSSNVCLTCQLAFEPTMVKYGVDAYFAGHTHLYERNKPTANYVVDPAGLHNPKYPWNIVNGCGGHYDGLDPMNKTLPYYADAGFNAVYGWSRVTVHNYTHLTHDFIASRNGTTLDSATLYKEHKNDGRKGKGGKRGP